MALLPRWEKYDAKGWTEKGAHKYGKLNEQSWWEKWGEHYDGRGSVLKWFLQLSLIFFYLLILCFCLILCRILLKICKIQSNYASLLAIMLVLSVERELS